MDRQSAGRKTLVGQPVERLSMVWWSVVGGPSLGGKTVGELSVISSFVKILSF